MKCLSVRQPWAWSIIYDGKDVENRDWFTRVRGRVLVHAAKTYVEHEYVEACDFMRSIGKKTPPDGYRAIDFGGIVGSVEIVDVVESSTSPWFFGRYGFVLRDPRPLPFLPFRGSLGFFEVPDHLVPAAA